MDEMERRVAALELAVTELAARLPPDTVRQVIRSIEAGFTSGHPADVRAIRNGAVQLLQDGLDFHD